jgi:hypothetical protein
MCIPKALFYIRDHDTDFYFNELILKPLPPAFEEVSPKLKHYFFLSKKKTDIARRSNGTKGGANASRDSSLWPSDSGEAGWLTKQEAHR